MAANSSSSSNRARNDRFPVSCLKKIRGRTIRRAYWQCEYLSSVKISDTLKADIAARLSTFERTQADPDADELRRAAVVLAITDTGLGADLPGLPEHQHWQSDAALLLTRRSARLRRHAGQWALPGGRVDEGETTEQAALRELREEIGLSCPTATILGILDDVVTRSGFAMTPLVVWAGSAQEIQANPDEVASIHRIPFTELLRADAPILTTIEHSEDPELRMPVGQSWIAAPTASVLYQFREVCLLGRTTRVDRFEQPRFTWR